MMAARFFLGVAEAGLFPGINYYLSCWYKRDEFGIRAAIFFSAAAVSGSFGGDSYFILNSVRQARLTGRSFYRFTRGGDREHGRCRWEARVGMDLYIGRVGDYFDRHFFILDGL